MSEELANAIVLLLTSYGALGLLFALAFHVRGIARVDAAAATGTRGFRALITPGVVALWPLLARRWIAGAGHPPAERNAHRLAAQRAGRTR